MGGYGSGRRPTRNNGTVSDMRRLDVRKMKREGCLEPGASGGAGAGAATVKRWRPSVITPCLMRYGWCTASANGAGARGMDYRVGLEWTPCNYGGSRVWFRCPSSHRRVAVIYGGKVFACRHCHRLAYDCQL